jgi:hypothetical protein
MKKSNYRKPFNKTTNQMHNQFKIYCFVAYKPLNVFRAHHQGPLHLPNVNDSFPVLIFNPRVYRLLKCRTATIHKSAGSKQILKARARNRAERPRKKEEMMQKHMI